MCHGWICGKERWECRLSERERGKRKGGGELSTIYKIINKFKHNPTTLREGEREIKTSSIIYKKNTLE